MAFKSKKDAIKIIIAVVLLIIAAVILVKGRTKHVTRGGETEIVILCNPETEQVFELQIPGDWKSPFDSHGENLAFYCVDCERNFAIDKNGLTVKEIREELKEKPPICPYCESTRIREYYYDITTGQSKIK